MSQNALVRLPVCIVVQVVLRLGVPQRGVFAVLPQEVAVRAELAKRAGVEHGDAVAKCAAGQPVRNIYRGFAGDIGMEAPVDFRLRLRVEPCGRRL